MWMCVYVHRLGTLNNLHTNANRRMKMNRHVRHEKICKCLVEL